MTLTCLLGDCIEIKCDIKIGMRKQIASTNLKSLTGKSANPDAFLLRLLVSLASVSSGLDYERKLISLHITFVISVALISSLFWMIFCLLHLASDIIDFSASKA